ncbi:MAG: hypothetical protein KAH57_10955 [Thermoplasmata archaeon]|nr:hypothetical protein [Thermoplasmata archaeon]
MGDELSAEKKGWWNNTALIIVVAVVSVLLLIMVSFGSVMYLWMDEFNDPYYYEEHRALNVVVEIDAAGEQLGILVVSGIVYWNEYVVKAQNNSYESFVLETSDYSSSAGDTATFIDHDWNPVIGDMYNIKIIEVYDNMVVWDRDNIAR